MAGETVGDSTFSINVFGQSFGAKPPDKKYIRTSWGLGFSAEVIFVLAAGIEVFDLEDVRGKIKVPASIILNIAALVVNLVGGIMECVGYFTRLAAYGREEVPKLKVASTILSVITGALTVGAIAGAIVDLASKKKDVSRIATIAAIVCSGANFALSVAYRCCTCQQDREERKKLRQTIAT